MQPDDAAFPHDAILAAGDDAPRDAWEPEDFDHFTDVGLLRALDAS
jgi:hypothetical protein